MKRCEHSSVHTHHTGRTADNSALTRADRPADVTNTALDLGHRDNIVFSCNYSGGKVNMSVNKLMSIQHLHDLNRKSATFANLLLPWKPPEIASVNDVSRRKRGVLGIVFN